MLALLLSLACAEAPAPPTPPPDPPRVVALSFPALWLVERLTAGLPLVVEGFTPPGEDPPAWQPEGEAVAALADARLIVANGMGYEAWTATAALPASRLVDSAAHVAPITLDGPVHSHGAKGEHSHAGLDPHTWMDPQSYLRQALAVQGALVEALPEHREAIEAAGRALEAELVALDAELERALAPARGRPMAANHPAFNHLARRYGLDIRSFDLDPELPLDEAARAAIAARVAETGTLWMWWEAPPSEATRATLPPGLMTLVVDPLEQPAEGARYDYLAGARANLAAFTRAFSAEDTARDDKTR